MPPPILSSLSTNNLIVDFPQEVTNALNGCKKLQPLTHLEVKNVSCYYYMRKKLRPKRHGNVSVKFNENTQKFDGFIYDLKRREEDLKIAPKKCLVASENDRWSAYKACEEALKERDKQKPIMEDEDIESRRPPKVLNLATHLQITVVSEKFVRVPPMGRLWMIYEALLESLGITADVQNPQSLYFCAPSSMKFTSTFGSQVTQLPFFQFLPFTIPNVHPTTTKFLFIPLTPAQWRPELYQPILSERIGQTRNFLTTIQMDPYTKPIIQKKRIQKLTTAKETSTSTSALFSKPAKKPSKKQSNLPKRVMNESLGLDQTVSGVTYNQVGGIYGHFFEDLSVSVKDMVLLRYEDNKDLIRRECHGDPTKGSSANDKDNYLADPHKIIADMEAREKASMGKPKTNATRFQTKSQKEASYEHTGEPDKGTNNTSEMKEHILISNKLIEWMAIRMQRMYRVYVFQKIMKKYWKSHYAAMQIQRIIRGKFARKYCSLLTVLQPFAVKKIQKFYRAIRSYCIRKHWHAMVYRLTRVVLPIIKDFIKRCYESWMSKRILSARKITNLIRMYLAKCITYKRHGQRVFFQLAFPKAATKIQAQIRRYLMVKWYQTIYIPECLHTLVDIPAAIRIQRIARGRLAKKQLKYLKYRYKCLVYLQRKLSEYVAKRWAKELAYEQRRQDSAILIQRRYRGHYDRKLFRLKYYFYWYHHIYIPNIIYVQSIVRCFLAKRYVGFLRVRHNAARTIQTGYRNYLKYQDFKRRKAELLKAFRQKSIICIQKYFRRFLQYKKFARLIQMERGRQLFAAKLIFRCWKNYQYKLRWEVMLNEFRNQQEKKQIDELAILKEDIREDIKEIKHDLGIAQRTKIRLKERLKEIDVFMTQCALRLQTISREMDKLTMEDFEQGKY